ncbi:hypothetical protein [Prescottella subtropica]|uniref:hypothetical protein n=1 Tax=Prescottella subtropica TaxID=2545757 RepID=UPI0010F904C2|nr:hypothetical protein [Prescottella subtropica]
MVVAVTGVCAEVVAGLAVVRAAGADSGAVGTVVACGVVDSTVVVSSGEVGGGVVVVGRAVVVVVVADVVDVVSGSA